MSSGTEHILTVDRDADLDRVIGSLDALDVRVVCIAVDVETAFDRAHQLTVRPRVAIDLPLLEYAVRRAGVDLFEIRPAHGGICVG